MHPRGKKSYRDSPNYISQRCLHQTFRSYADWQQGHGSVLIWSSGLTVSLGRSNSELKQPLALRMSTSTRASVLVPGMRLRANQSVPAVYSQDNVHVTSSLTSTHSSSILASYHEAFVAERCPLGYDSMYRVRSSSCLDRQLPRRRRCTNGISAEPQHGTNDLHSLSP